MKLSLLALLLLAPAFCRADPAPPAALIDRLTPQQIGLALDKIRSASLLGRKIDDAELDRARLQGLLARMGTSVRLLSNTPGAAPGTASKEVFHSEILPRSILYLRLGELSDANVASLAATLAKSTKAPAVILDLRATRAGDSYDLAARVINLFTARSGPYFQLITGDGGKGRAFSGTADPVFSGILVILINADCSGPAETMAACLRQRGKGLVVGTRTAGQALEFATFPLDQETTLQVAVASITLPAGGPDLAVGVQPDLPLSVPLDQEREILAASASEGIGKFIFEVEQPHMSEASLVADRNPEIDLYQARQARGDTPEAVPLLDRSLQHALDTITTVLVYRAPKPGP